MSETPSPDWQLDYTSPKPASFDANQWRIIKEAGKTVAASNLNTGEVRKLPRHWFD